MKTVYYFISVVIIFMIGCSTVQSSTVEQQKKFDMHQYEISVVDVDENPIKGAKIEYNFNESSMPVESGSYITTSDGIYRGLFNVVNKGAPDSWDDQYSSSFDFKVSKDGYYPKSGSRLSAYTSHNIIANRSDNKTITKARIVLLRPIDYFNKKFASSISDANLKTRLLSFIDLIVVQGFLAPSVLEEQSINLVSFKNKNYLQFKFNNVNEYNSIKLSKYDIGKIIFDEVIKKVLTPLNRNIGNSKLFYGYDLTVVGHTRSFIDENAKPQSIEYRFMIPENIVRKYKDKDISAQKVLDESIILMDDDRIELKLQ